MELLMKTGGLLLLSGCAVLLVRKTNPEMSLALSILSVCCVLLLALPALSSLRELRQTVHLLYGVSEVYLIPTFKCCACGIVSKLTADLCREASQTAAASAVELVGLFCALGAAMPLLTSMLTTIGEML